MKIGCIVQLLSGGPLMTVKDAYEGNRANCVWFDNFGVFHEHEFPKHLLKVVAQ